MLTMHYILPNNPAEQECITMDLLLRIMEMIKPTHRRTKTNFIVTSGNPNGSATIETSSRITNDAAA